MRLQKILEVLVKAITYVFCLSSSSAIGGRNCYRQAEYGGGGPRIMVVRKDGTHHLTGLFTINAGYDEKGKLLFCKPLVILREPGDKWFFGNTSVYGEYKRLQEEKLIPA